MPTAGGGIVDSGPPGVSTGAAGIRAAGCAAEGAVASVLGCTFGTFGAARSAERSAPMCCIDKRKEQRSAEVIPPPSTALGERKERRGD